MKNPIPNWFNVREPIFNSSVHVFRSCNIEGLNAWIKKYCASDSKLFDPKEEANTEGLSIMRNNPEGKIIRIIWLRDLSWRPRQLGILSHEVFHLTCDILTGNQITISGGESETAAYLHEYYFRSILKHIKQSK
jgi:hypothetical protein